MMSVRTTCLDILPSSSISVTKPVDIPATCLEMGTPASMSANEPPQTLAMEVDPFEDIISDTILIA